MHQDKAVDSEQITDDEWRLPKRALTGFARLDAKYFIPFFTIKLSSAVCHVQLLFEMLYVREEGREAEKEGEKERGWEGENEAERGGGRGGREGGWQRRWQRGGELGCMS